MRPNPGTLKANSIPSTMRAELAARVYQAEGLNQLPAANPPATQAKGLQSSKTPVITSAA